MNFLLWILQFLLAALFMLAGFVKSFQPVETLPRILPWVSSLPPEVIRFIGVSELLGAVGLLLPLITGSLFPKLPVIASLFLGLVMVNAAMFHAFRGEYQYIAVNMAILTISLFVAYGRWKLAPIKARRDED